MTTTTTVGKFGLPPTGCDKSCSQVKFNSYSCDQECNNYECLFDHGACGREMTGKMSKARMLGMIGQTQQALAMFRELCAITDTLKRQLVTIPSSAAKSPASEESHEARMKAFKVQELFALNSCISARNLALGQTFDGKANNEVTGTLSWDHLKASTEEKLDLLDTMDSEIGRVKQMQATFGATGRIEGSLDGGLKELGGAMKSYIGDSTAQLHTVIKDQTKEMRHKQKENERQMNKAVELQRRVLAETMRNGDGIAEMDSKVDAITADVDLLISTGRDLTARLDSLRNISELRHAAVVGKLDSLTAATDDLSVTQRQILVSVKRNYDAVNSVKDSTQEVLTAVLANTVRLTELSDRERQEMNRLMQAEYADIAACTILTNTATELSKCQRLIILEIQANKDIRDIRGDIIVEELSRLLDGTITPKSLKNSERDSINQLIAVQRTLTGFSLTWDDDGNGRMASTEQVALAMDLALPATSAVGKVLAPFRTQTEVPAATVRTLLQESLGSKAVEEFDNLRRSRRVRRDDDVTAEEAMEVAEKVGSLTGVTWEMWDAVSEFKGGDWRDVSTAALGYATELLAVDSPMVETAIDLTTTFIQFAAEAARNPIAAVAGAVGQLACSATGVEMICDGTSCISVAAGVAVGAAAGNIVGAGISLVQSALSGDLGSCVNGVIEVGEKVFNLIAKFAEPVIEFIGDAVGAVVDVVSDVVEVVADGIGAAVDFVVDVGSSIVGGVVSAVEWVADGVSDAWNWATSWWRRARRSPSRSRRAELSNIFGDSMRLANTAMRFYNAANGLFFNVTGPVPLDIGPLILPEIEAKYYSTSNKTSDNAYSTPRAFTTALIAFQSHAQKRVDFDARISATEFLTDSVGRCLLDNDCELQDRVDRYGQALQLMNLRREETVYQILEEFTTMNNVFQYWSLEPKMEFMLSDSPSSVDLRSLFVDFTNKHTSVLSGRGGQPTEATVYYTFDEGSSPAPFNDLKENGVAFFTIPLDLASKYRDVRVSGHDVQAYIYPSSKNAGSSTASIQISKGGYSSFSPTDPAKAPMTFLHTDLTSTRLYSFIYDTNTCDRISEPCTSDACSKDDFLEVSPYGEWKIELAGRNESPLLETFQIATQIRFAFKVRWFLSSSESVYASDLSQSDAMFASDSCSGGPICFVQPSVPLVSIDECAGPAIVVAASNGKTGMSSGGKAALALFLIVLIIGGVGFVFREQLFDTWIPQLREWCPCCGGRAPGRNRGAITRGFSGSDLGAYNNPHYARGSDQQHAARNPRAQRPRIAKPKPATVVNTDLPMYGEGKCTYISPTSGRACKNNAEGLFCERLHLCTVANCGKSKASTATVCDACSAPEANDAYGEDMAVYEAVDNAIGRSISQTSVIIPVRGRAGRPIGRSNSTSSDV